MHRFFLPALSAAVFAAVFGVAGCQSSQAEPGRTQDASASPQTQPEQQLMLKFRAADPSFACDAPGIARFATAAGVRLAFARNMSGGACVVRHTAADAAGLARGLDLMRRHPAVDWVEVDAMMKAL